MKHVQSVAYYRFSRAQEPRHSAAGLRQGIPAEGGVARCGVKPGAGVNVLRDAIALVDDRARVSIAA
jgi:hypothetical protein